MLIWLYIMFSLALGARASFPSSPPVISPPVVFGFPYELLLT